MALYNYITASGTIVPDTADILAVVQEEYKTVFGQDLVVTPDTPQGLLINAETLGRVAVAINNAQLGNQLNPNIAGGVYLDAILALMGAARTVTSNSVVSVNLAGVAGTVIPLSVRLANSTGDLFAPVGATILSGAGTATINFQAVETGAIAAPAGTLTTIKAGVLGLETATNPTDATLGTATQSDDSTRVYRVNVLGQQSSGGASAMLSGLFATPNVTSARYRENYKGTTQIIDGLSLLPHSIYACVTGGTDLDVATTILTKKNPGCDYNSGFGTPVTVNVTDPSSGQVYPISFDRPIIKNIVAKITVSQGTAIVDPTTAVIKAILDYANGIMPGKEGFKIGVAVSCFELAGAVAEEVPGLYIHNVLTSLVSPLVFSNAEIPITLYQQASIVASSITVVVI